MFSEFVTMFNSFDPYLIQFLWEIPMEHHEKHPLFIFYLYYSDDHLLVITGYNWDDTFYKWGFVSSYNWYFWP